MMDEFVVESFAEKPLLLMLDSLKKADLLAIVQHYKLLSTAGLQKRERLRS